MVTWVLGTLVLWILVMVSLHRDGVLPAALTTFSSALYLLIAYAALSGLGFYAAMFTVGWLVTWMCLRINGAPFAVGDQVILLTGPQAGKVATVYGHTRGQGGDLLPCVDLGPEERERYRDIFQDYTLLHYSSGDGDSGK